MRLIADLREAAAPARAFAALGVGWGAFNAQVPDLKARIGAGDGVFGLTLALGALGLTLALWLAPRLDRRAGAAAMPVGVAILAAAFLLPGVAASPVAFAGGMLLVTAASGLLDVTMNTRLSETEGRAGRPLLNLGHAVFSLSYAPAALMAGFAREAGWPPVVIFAAAAAVMLALGLGARQAPEGVAEAPPAPREVMRAPALLWACGALCLLAFAIEGGVENWSALHLERTFGLPPAGGALGPALLGLTMGLGRLGGQVVSGRIAPMPLAAAAGVLDAAGGALAAAAPAPFGAYAGFGLVGLGVSVMGPLAIAEGGRRAAERGWAGGRGRAVGQVAVIGFAGFFVGPPLLGGLSEAFGLRAAVGGLGAMGLIGAVLALRLGAISPLSRICKP